jgi:hypothetical protein
MTIYHVFTVSGTLEQWLKSQMHEQTALINLINSLHSKVDNMGRAFDELSIAQQEQNAALNAHFTAIDTEIGEINAKLLELQELASQGGTPTEIANMVAEIRNMTTGVQDATTKVAAIIPNTPPVEEPPIEPEV